MCFSCSTPGVNNGTQITRLPAYYLTEAEASILRACGPNIISSCVQDGSLLVELGAG